MHGEQVSEQKDKFGKRKVGVDLVEQTPGNNAAGHWLLASPMLVFVAWLWIDIFNYYSPLPRPVDYIIGLVLFVALVVLPLGLLAHRFVTSFPRVFHHAGWDVQPSEPIGPEEQYLVKYQYGVSHRSDSTWSRWWIRAGQGWVYLEIAAIFVGAIAMIPLFFSASDFGFGQR